METAKKLIIEENKITEVDIKNKIASTFENIVEDAKIEMRKDYLDQTMVEAGGE